MAEKSSKIMRESGIELLRILATLGVVILHYNNGNIGGALKFAARGSLNIYVLFAIEAICICAVDLFMLISGYFSYGKTKVDARKVIRLMEQRAVIAICIYLIRVAIGSRQFAPLALVKLALPTNFFIVAYSVVYVLSPYINMIIQKLDWSGIRRLLMAIIILFSLAPFLTTLTAHYTGWSLNEMSTISTLGSSNGYNILTYVMMYILGVCIRKRGEIKLSARAKIIAIAILIACWMFCATGGYRYSAESGKLGFYFGYDNPAVIASAVIIFVLFSHIKIGSVKWINGIAKASFTVYLTHTYLLDKIGIKEAVQGGVASMLLHMVISAIGLYIVGYIVWLIYSFLTKGLYKYIDNRFKPLWIGTDFD